MRKITSTNSINEFDLITNCPMAYALSLIGGRWKPLILWYVQLGYKRFHLLKKVMPLVATKVLAQQLKELQNDGLLIRNSYPETPPRVEYELTHTGETLIPVLKLLNDWGGQHRQDNM